jgi:ABC-type dipeptide/oligopeptide/nickel transport system permease subunit
MLAVTIINVPIFARIARASMLAEKAKSYVEAALSLGGGPGRIMFLTILPNCVPPILVQVTVSAGYAILLEAALSFLGLGAQPPEPSWGTMLNFGRTYLNRAPWYGIFPGLAISLLVLGLHFFADALRDALDPTHPLAARGGG